jgi:taurine-pyruvate aminotransferase
VGDVWHPMSGYDPDAERMVVVGGDGAHVVDQHGNRYLDGKSGLWCVNVGYGREELAKAGYEQLRTLPYYPLTETHQPAERLGEKLNEWLGGEYVFFFSNSGSEANEVAFKIARQYQGLLGEHQRWKFVSRYRAYHGQTPYALAATGQNQRKVGYEPLPAGFLHVTPPDEYRCHLCAGRCSLACAGEIDRTVQWELPETIAGVIVEPIITGGGMIVPADGYLPEVRRICDSSGALLIVDEAICGFGRTGRAFGFEHYGVVPDIVTMAKAVTSGYFPLAVTAVRREIYTMFPPTGQGRFRHINTFGGHPVGCAIAVTNMDIMEREDLFTRAHRAGELLRSALAALADHPLVGQIRGKGLLTGIELVADKQTKQPAAATVIRAILAECLRRGLIAGTNANTAAGLANVITVGPPLTVADDEITYIAETLYHSITTVMSTT